MQFLFDDGNQHAGGHGAPDLRLYRVLFWPRKALDAQLLFDSFEKQFHLPVALLQHSNGHGWQRRVVAQKYQRLVRHGVLISDAPQMPGAVSGRSPLSIVIGFAAGVAQLNRTLVISDI